MNILRTIVWFFYFFGYLVLHIPVLSRGKKALAAGDLAAVDAITDRHVAHWCNTLLKLAGVTLTVEGKENIPETGACVFVANHRGYYDIPIMLTQMDRPHGLLAKQEIDRIPLVRQWMRLLGCVFVQRDDVRASMHALNAAADAVKSGRRFTIFPEGTRYKGEEGGIGEFKGGAFRIALKTGAPLVPVALSNTRNVFETHHGIMTPTHICVRILPAVSTTGLTREQQKALPAAVQESIHAALQATATTS